MKKIILPIVVIAALLSSCTTETIDSSSVDGSSIYNKIYSPTGAPAIAFYDQGTNSNFETNQTPANVLAQLTQDNYGMIVFDFYNGLNTLLNYEGHYKLARIITAGNLYLVGINKTTQPTSDDYIVSFGEGLIPDLAYKYLYDDEIVANTSYVSSTTEAGAVLAAGIYQGEAVDYVVVAQPTLNTILNNEDAATYGQLTVIASFKDMWYEKTGQNGIPQAGLFINMNYYEQYQSYYDEQLALLDDRIDTCINDPITMKSVMDSQLSEDEQSLLFGFTSSVAYNVQANEETPNGFALLGSDETIDISAFFSILGITTDYSDYIL